MANGVSFLPQNDLGMSARKPNFTNGCVYTVIQLRSEMDGAIERDDVRVNTEQNDGCRPSNVIISS